MPAYFTPADHVFSRPQGGDTVVREFLLADVNGDGRTDAVLTYQLFPLENRPIPVRVLLGDGAGGFSDGTAGMFLGGAPRLVDGRAHVLADLDGDGRKDLFLADAGYGAAPYPGAPNVLALSGGGTWAEASGRLPANSDYTPTAAGADIDRDGDVDLFVGDLGQRGPYFLINDGRAGFTLDQTRLPDLVANPTFGRYATALLFDADGDGAPDLFLGGDGDSKVLLNDGTGRFAIPGGMTFPIAGPHQVVDAQAADLNGDGRQDIVLTVAGDGFSRASLQVLINQGGGVFADETAHRLPRGGVVADGGWVYRAPLVDLNGDGAMDIVLSGGADSARAILLNDGMGRFTPAPGLVPSLGVLDRLAVGDIDGDGRTDLVVARSGGPLEQFTVYRSVDAGHTQTGDAGANSFLGDADGETMSGGAGDDVVFGGGGDDYLRGDEGGDRLAGGPGFDDINGNMGDDTASGGLGPDWVVGGKDNDLLFGDLGDDIVYGNLGHDTVHGGDGADIVRGGQGDDVVTGGLGNDWLAGDRGADTLSGGAGADTFHIFADAGVDRVTDFNAAEGDRVQLLPGATYAAAQVGADVVVDVGGGGQLVLANVQLTALAAGWIFGT
ncbi:FG-GAP-like repeat-containing protein [Phenylobacterium sp.]|uniref:FG-GAP-like repeat-containing protein n=1 Tax=Phenylobacterium sp. TaxID=1871053 RepID=UPI0035B27EE4